MRVLRKTGFWPCLGQSTWCFLTVRRQNSHISINRSLMWFNKGTTYRKIIKNSSIGLRPIFVKGWGSWRIPVPGWPQSFRWSVKTDLKQNWFCSGFTAERADKGQTCAWFFSCSGSSTYEGGRRRSPTFAVRAWNKAGKSGIWCCRSSAHGNQE